MTDILQWGPVFERFVRDRGGSDPAHDLDHVRRVVSWSVRLTRAERARVEVTYPAAWLHDCANVPKDASDRGRASTLAAEQASDFLRSAGYVFADIAQIAHAIAAHSFSAGIAPTTLEAAIVQDADRLDALGAIGIARCLMIGGGMSRPLCAPSDPFCRARKPNDREATLDHFYAKLLKLVDSMKTATGRREARTRTDFMIQYLSELESEITPQS